MQLYARQRLATDHEQPNPSAELYQRKRKAREKIMKRLRIEEHERRLLCATTMLLPFGPVIFFV